LRNPIAAAKNRPTRPMLFGLRHEMIVIPSVKMTKPHVGVISHGKSPLLKNPIATLEMASELQHLCDEFYPISISRLYTNVRNFV
jgi:hypothetical protein